MQDTILTILAIGLVMPSMGIMVWFFISTATALSKFERLDKFVQKKLVFMDYYMYLVRLLTVDELIKIGTLSDEEMVNINRLRDTEKGLKLIKEKINQIKSR